MFRNESEFVRWLRRLVPAEGGSVRLGIGDDAAWVNVGRGQELILTTDLSVEGVHFTRALHPPRSVGHRALARSLSDIAAMGGTARFALVSLGISPHTTQNWIEECYAGLIALARQHRVRVVGGDTAVVFGSAILDVMVTGEVPRGKAILRSGARPGHELFVSGTLGLSALGLRLLKRGVHVPSFRRSAPSCAPTIPTSSECIRAHLYPEPQCALGRFLEEKRLASALIDISDGLSTDLGRLCEASGVGARIWADRIPRAEIPAASRLHGGEGLERALHGGEDYQLLFTVAPGKTSKIPSHFRGLPLRPIGEIRSPKELLLVGMNGRETTLRAGGYDHFQNQ